MAQRSRVQRMFLNRNMGFIFMGIFCLMLVILLVYALVNRTSSTGEQAQGNPAQEQTSTTEACDVPEDASTMQNPVAPSDVRWILNDKNIRYAVSDTVGPVRHAAADDLVGHCFARTPMGAVMAISYTLGMMEDSNKPDSAVGTLMENPSDITEERNSSEDSEDDNTSMEVVGYDIKNFTPNKATVGLVNQVIPAGGVQGVYMEMTCQLVWKDGDWKLPKNGCPRSGISQVSEGDFHFFKQD